MKTDENLSTDVVIVGAGLAGLAAADHLQQMGHEVLVVEGRDRIGGRVHTTFLAGVPVDCGATWVGPNHSAVRDLADRLGCTFIPQHNEGESILAFNGRRTNEDAVSPLIDPNINQITKDINRIFEAIAALVESLPTESAWLHPEAEALDSISVASWLSSKKALRNTRKFMNMFCLVHWGAPIEDISFFNALRYIKTLGGVEAMMSVDGGNEQDRILGSAHMMVSKLADTLGSRLIINSPVLSISNESDHAIVKTETQTISTKYVIVAVSPIHRSTIVFRPLLPEQHYGLARSWRLGALSKAFAAYKTPFWRDQGLSGQAVSDNPIAFLTFDVSPTPEGPGIMMAFCEGHDFDKYEPKERRKLVIDQLAQLYGEKARDIIDYADFSWGNDSFAPGGPNPALAPKTWTSFGKFLREPVGQIHWAGTETADDTSGTMNGAILSGQRAAAEVASRLQATVNN
ncbi:FAD-dependent oxidoreductase [Salmonella enterica]|nr:FAD-dependent oxidoreductase [Salmonella enterica]